MKKQLLLASALLLMTGTFAQKQKQLFENGKVAEDKKYSNNFTRANMDVTNPVQPQNKSINSSNETTTSSSSASKSSALPILSSKFYRISGSMNVYGFLVASSKPLSYNRVLNAVSFIQRKPGTYVTSPDFGGGNSGAIVAFYAKNDASSNSIADWDSTLIYGHPTNYGRYPQGGLYNPPMNSNLANAVAVGMGPVTGGSGWLGNWYASKSLTATPKNAVGTDVQYFANTTPFTSPTSPTMTKHDFPRYGFKAANGGNIFTMGSIVTDVNATTNAAYGFRGAAIVKGTYVAGAMVWSPDSIKPPTELRTDGSKLVNGEPYMAWNADASVGYVMFIGMRQGAAAGTSNRGMQPIVYKTTDGGTNWNLTNSIDWTQPAYNQIKNTIRSVNIYTNTEAPWFWGEGIDVAVDKDNKLHIFSTVIGHASSHVDSMSYLSRWTINGEDYHWPHVNTARPLLVDYVTDGTNWNPVIVDSIGTEGPSQTSGEPGFNFNPWGDPTANNSVSSDMRLQITRSYDGEFLAYSWAESDTTITSSANKWNEFPNVMTRAYRVCDGKVSTDKFAVTSPATEVNTDVRDKAYFHYMSSEMKAGQSTATTATFSIPFSVTNNAATEGINPVNNYYATSQLLFNFPSSACGATIATGVANIAKTDADNSIVYPNPTKNSVNVAITLSQASAVTISVYNAIGQLVSSNNSNGQIGANVINVNLNNANAGVYFVKVKAGNAESTKKLVVE